MKRRKPGDGPRGAAAGGRPTEESPLTAEGAHGGPSGPSPSLVATESSSAMKDEETRGGGRIKDASQLRISMLFDPSLPWVLVENGSLGGFFDWVPLHWRIGNWSRWAIVYWAALNLLTAAAGVHLLQQRDSLGSWWSDICAVASTKQELGSKVEKNHSLLSALAQLLHMRTANEPTASELCLRNDMYYPTPFSAKWLYNSMCFFWMLVVVYSILCQSPMGLRAWGTYTVQAWTLLTVRHGLSALAPFSTRAALLAEAARFPAACSTTVTFVVWNLALAPFIYLHGMDSAEKRRGFVRFCCSFRLVQIHVLNIVFCYLNIAWASPPRELHEMDFYLAVLSVVVYMLFYLFILDRIGVHLYPIFSPRLRGMVVVSWSSILGLYALTFWMWKKLLSHG